MTGIVSSPSWPGLFRPSAHQRQGADGRNKPGHDGETKANVSSYRENALVTSMIALSGTFVVQRTRCSREVRQSCDQATIRHAAGPRSVALPVSASTASR